MAFKLVNNLPLLSGVNGTDYWNQNLKMGNIILIFYTKFSAVSVA